MPTTPFNDFLIIDMLEWIQKVRERYVSKNSQKRSEAEKDTYNALLFKLNTYQVLSDEMRGKLAKFKTTIKEKLSGSLSSKL